MEKFSNEQNNNQWFQVEEDINKEERKKAEEKNSVKVEHFNLNNSAIKKNMERILDRITEKESLGEAKEKKDPFSKGAEELISLRWKNLIESFREFRRKEDDIILDEICLQKAVQTIREKDTRVISTKNEITDGLVDEISTLKWEQEELKQTSPEAYIGLNLSNFKEQIERAKRGMLVETNYVKEKKENILKAMKAGEHIFLHGHLGGGKTDLAVETCIDRMVDLHINREMDDWLEKNPEAQEKEIIATYRGIKEKHEYGVETGDSEIMEKVRPFLISGSKDFDLRDLYIEKKINVVKFNGKEIREHNKNINKEVKKWKEDNKEELSKLSEEEAKKAEYKQWDRIQSLYEMNNKSGFGTVVEDIKKELFRAVEEGKPIIIDEANAIPPTVLISMNDILTKGPGKMAYIPGVGPVEVKEGFNVIMTGNLETSSLAEYLGTEEMNPAFLSRLKVEEYDYLPQNTGGNVYEQENSEQNELFQTVIAFLANEDGSLKLSEGAMDKLFKLTQLAKITQEVFSGRWRESDIAKDASGDEALEPKLEKSVLSIRNIINVLKEWNKGQEMDLDMALFKAFISNAIIPSDQNFILNEAKKYGFFSDTDGWDVRSSKMPILVDIKDIRKRKYEYMRPKDYMYSPRDTVQILYGKAPERLKFPDMELKAFAKTEVSGEKIDEFEEFEDEFNKYENAFEKFLEKEGC